jgi:hypothetical protein
LGRVLEHGLEFFFGLTLADLGADSGGEFNGFEREGDNVIGAEIQGACALQRAALNDHDNFERRLCGGERFELSNEAATAQVGRRGFGDQNVRREREDFVHGEGSFGVDLVALPGEGLLYRIVSLII